MKKLLIAATALSGFLALTGAASAADTVVTDPVYDWTGFYVGLQGGYGFGDNDWNEDGGGSTDADDFEGFVGGVTAGANFQMDSIVLGVEGDLSFSDLSAELTANATFVCGIGGTCDTDSDWFGTLRGRLGFAMGNTLPYITGGLAVGDAEGTTSQFGQHGEDTLYGWTAGVGIEHAFSENFSAKLEYIYVDLGDLDLPTLCTVNCETSVNFNVIRAGLNFNF